jgi:hypothetical protein
MSPAARATAALLGALVAVLSYTVQRVVDAVGEPPAAAILQSATIAYFWRVPLAVLHGAAAALLARALPPAAAATLLDRAPVLVAAVLLPCVAALAWAR